MFCRSLSTSLPNDLSSDSSLSRILANRIRSTGPLTVAEFMRESLLHPTLGYYSKKQRFIGKNKDSSDFFTSPEISAMFGELLGVWVIHQIQQQNLTPEKYKSINLVEFGPGTGTMMNDILRVNLNIFDQL